MRAATDLKDRFLGFYKKNEVLVSALVFAGGFVFDLLTLGRIDDLFNLIQQGFYLVILGTLLFMEIKILLGDFIPMGKTRRFWDFHDLIVHFLFGSLLSVYTIFYFTSASALTSFFFILLLVGLMFANEFPQFQRIGLTVRVILYNICLLSYFAFFYPILMGHVGPLPFWLGFLTSLAGVVLVWKLNFKSASEVFTKRVLIPALIVHGLFLGGYYLSLIPPVPVAVKQIGVYYDVEKVEGQYLGKHLRPWYKFWQKGSQEFKQRPDDRIVVLLSIFSPANFKDKIFLTWFIDDPKLGWTQEDSIPMTILGGREEGFRGFGRKQNFRPGNWRVLVETNDGREVGRISFTVEADSSATVREFKSDVF